MPSLVPVYLELIAVAVMWSHAPVLIKYCLRYIGPWDLVIVRHVPATLVFLLFYALSRRRSSLVAMIRADWWRFFIVGFFAISGYHFTLNTGTQYITAGTAALIIGTVPVFTFLIAAAVLGERTTWVRATGIVLAFVGLYVCVRYGGGQSLGVTYFLGALVTLIAPLFSALFTTLSRPLSQRYGGLNTAALTIIFGTLPLLVTVTPSMVRPLPTLPGSFWAALLFLSLGCTALAYVFWAHALKRLEATRVAVFIYAIPLLGLMWGRIYLGEPITVWLVLGGVMIVAGLVLTNRAASNRNGSDVPRIAPTEAP